MFAGHFGIGFLFLAFTQKSRSQSAFFLTMLSVQFIDIVAMILSILGIEGGSLSGHSSTFIFDIKWSHSFIMVIIWSILYASLIVVLANNNFQLPVAQIFILFFFGVLSHFLLDFIVHGSDLYLSPWNDIVTHSLYLWKYPIAGLLSELCIVYLSLFIYNKKANIMKKYALLRISIILSLLAIIIYIPSFLPSPEIRSSPLLHAGFGLVIIGVCLLLTKMIPIE